MSRAKKARQKSVGSVSERASGCFDIATSDCQMTAAYLLEKVSWTGITDSKANLTALRTRQLCDAMTVSKDLIANIHLSAGGRAVISTSGGGSTSELTNWDGTKKRTGWGI